MFITSSDGAVGSSWTNCITRRLSDFQDDRLLYRPEVWKGTRDLGLVCGVLSELYVWKNENNKVSG